MASFSTERRRAEAGQDLLYQVLERSVSTFLAIAERADRPIRPWVARELRSYLSCGIPAHGFTWLRCPDCEHDVILPFSCKGRGFCPSCGGRRMSQTAANLVDRVLPDVPVRQWVLSLPMPLRLQLAWRPALCRSVRRVFLRAVRGLLVRKAKRLGLRDPDFGAVCFTQRFGSALNVNVHFHALVLDGVYALDGDGVPRFHELPRLTDDEVARLVATIRRRVERHLRRVGLFDDDPLAHEDDGLFAVQAASAGHRAAMGQRAGRRTRRRQLLPEREPRLPRLCAQDAWYSLHAGVRIPAGNRAGLERLCRYVARPPLSHDRLTRRADGDLEVRLKTPWRDGTTHLVLSELELIERLAALIPPPRAHLVTYHGVLAPAAPWRAAVVPASEEAGAPCPHRAAPHERWIPWAELLKRTFAIDALACSRCGGRLTVRAVVRGTWHSEELLGVLGVGHGFADMHPARDGPEGPEDLDWA